MSATASASGEKKESDLRYDSVLPHPDTHAVSQYLAVGEDRKADGTLFSQHSLDKLSVVGLF